jgi:hypothetical protein
MSEKSFKTVTFSGTREGYHVWEFKMRAFLREIGCADSLDRPDMNSSVSDPDERKRNDRAYSRIALAMNMDDIVSSNLVRRSISATYPDGDAAMAWNALADRYAPKKAVDRQTLVTELFATKLDKQKDPEIWIVELQRMQSKLQEMGENISDGLLMAHILGNLPPEYENVSDNLASQDNKTILSVTVALKDKFERLKKVGKLGSADETALIGYKKFSGNCRYCGKKGHKASDCFKKRDADSNKNGSGRNKIGFKGTCHHCGKKGHKKSECYQLKNKMDTEESGAVVLIADVTNNDEFLVCKDTLDEVDAEVIEMNGYESIDSYVDEQRSNQPKLSWAEMCESSVDDSVDDDETGPPDLLSAASESSADDWDDDFQDDFVMADPLTNDGEQTINQDSLEDYCLMAEYVEIKNDLMIADTGATVHMRRNTDGMFDLRHEKCIVKYGNGSSSTSTMVGKWSGIVDDNGTKKKVILENVTVVPGSAYNLFSLTRVLGKGTLTSHGEKNETHL